MLERAKGFDPPDPNLGKVLVWHPTSIPLGDEHVGEYGVLSHSAFDANYTIGGPDAANSFSPAMMSRLGYLFSIGRTSPTGIE
jgi:hypothetical protein